MEGEQRGGGRRGERPEQANVTLRTGASQLQVLACSQRPAASTRGQAICPALGAGVQHSAQASAGSLAGSC